MISLAKIGFISVLVYKLKSVKYNRNQTIEVIPENEKIIIFSDLYENIKKGNPNANININSTLPAFPIKDDVSDTLIIKVIIYKKRANVRCSSFLEIIAVIRKMNTVEAIKMSSL